MTESLCACGTPVSIDGRYCSSECREDAERENWLFENEDHMRNGVDR